MEDHTGNKNSGNRKAYGKFGWMLFASFIAMYLLMFINMDQIAHFQFTLTRIYMAVSMIAVMAVIMLLFMRGMYRDKKLNAAILIGSAVLFFGFLAMLRNQVFISDIQWMRGMIPHHSSAIMTSENANLRDSEAKELSREIIATQKLEIEEMQKIIDRLEKNGE